MNKLLRDPWEVSLFILLVTMWASGFVFGYMVGWHMGDPFAALYRWVRNSWSRHARH